MMIRIKTYKYRLYPTQKQQDLLAQHFGACRWVYNYALEKKIECYTTTKRSLSCYDLMKDLTKLKKQEDTKWLTEVSAQVLQQSLIHLDKAYTQFFKKKSNFPRFKTKKSKQSVSFPQYTRVDFEKNKLYVIKFKEGIKCRFHRTFDGIIKTATITKTKTNKYFVSICVEEEIPEVIQKPLNEETAVGIDLGIKTYLVTSNGINFDNPSYYKKLLSKLQKEQRRLSKKKKGSNNREKQRMIVAKVYEKVSNQRQDFLHKVSRQLVNESQINTYCLETLTVERMLKNHNLARSIQDASWSTFVEYLSYKAKWEGKNILRIGCFEPSSKTCNVCGIINHDLTLKDREWTCTCGAEHDRDINASINIRKIAFDKQNLVGWDTPKRKPAEIE